jgi:hypothetical protein
MLTGFASGAKSSEYKAVMDSILPSMSQATAPSSPGKKKRSFTQDSDCDTRSSQFREDSDDSEEGDRRYRKKVKWSQAQGSKHGNGKGGRAYEQKPKVVCGFCSNEGHA